MFVIREKSSGAFCLSSGRRIFSRDIEDAALFKSYEAAEKAANTMFEEPGDPLRLQYREWFIDGDRFHPDLDMYIKQYTGWCGLTEADIRASVTQLVPDLQVVEVRIILFPKSAC